jgi:hypothetical protein
MITEQHYQRMMNEYVKSGVLGTAAMKAGMHRETAAKYLEACRWTFHSHAGISPHTVFACPSLLGIFAGHTHRPSTDIVNGIPQFLVRSELQNRLDDGRIRAAERRLIALNKSRSGPPRLARIAQLSLDRITVSFA